MKNALILLFLVLPSLAFAQDVKITSFHLLSSNSSVAELCGTLSPAPSAPQMIKITSDPRLKTPGLYHVWTGLDGQFCSVISSLSGEADAVVEH